MNELQVYEKPLTATEIKAQVQVIQQVMAAVMVKDVHYGVIPGTPKPTLYKPGSEKILATFRITAYPKEVEDLSTHDEIRYRVKVHGISAYGLLLGVGIGECSSSEEKYRWRRPVCDEEWNEYPEDQRREVWKRIQGKPTKLKQVRTHPSDVANTILKMAKKRAQIDMTLTATAASDVFDQDLEDLPEGLAGEATNGKPPLQEPKKKEKAPAPPKDDLETASVLIEGITYKDGKTKAGKNYRKFTITDTGGNTYGTFSESAATTANTAKESGAPCRITYKTGQYGNDLETIDIIIPEK